MKHPQARRRCRCCSKSFTPDHRNATRQHYCTRPRCRRARKAASQRRWRSKDGNGDYFRGPKQVARVKLWRKSHPGYWKKGRLSSRTTQPAVPQQAAQVQASCNVPTMLAGTLQDSMLIKDPMFVGLISMISGSTLQDDIEITCRDLVARGCEILRSKSATGVPSIPRSKPGSSS